MKNFNKSLVNVDKIDIVVDFKPSMSFRLFVSVSMHKVNDELLKLALLKMILFLIEDLVRKEKSSILLLKTISIHQIYFLQVITKEKNS